jgi:hypothetical protein
MSSLLKMKGQMDREREKEREFCMSSWIAITPQKKKLLAATS